MMIKAISCIWSLLFISKNNIGLLSSYSLKFDMVVQYLNVLFDHFSNHNNITIINVSSNVLLLLLF
jgi:hypothetical protein